MIPPEGVVHMQVRLAERGVWTACGHIVHEIEASTDCLEVTCEAAGCRTEADARFELRRMNQLRIIK